jgi:uncharacterized protein
MMPNTNKQVLIAGATGLIGQELTHALVNMGYSVVLLPRSIKRAKQKMPDSVTYLEWDGSFSTWLVKEVERSAVIVNLAGEGIANKRWTKLRRMQLVRSRLGTTRILAKACHYAKSKPEVFIQGSAIGYYPLSTDEVFSEDSAAGTGFLSRLTSDWEAVAKNEVPNEIRLVLLRSGVVLSHKGGMLPKMLKPVKFFVGGWFGSGNQVVSWIHIVDEIKAIITLMLNPKANGAFNLVAPNPVSQKNLVKQIGYITKKPAWICIPRLPIKLIMGQMADELLYGGSRVESKKLNEINFHFSYPTIEVALNNLI